MGAGVDGVVQEIGADTAVVEERIALGRGAVPDDRFCRRSWWRSGSRAAHAWSPSPFTEVQVGLDPCRPASFSVTFMELATRGVVA